MKAIRSNKARTGITVGIIALGITALIGIITAIQGLNSSIVNNFNALGINTFSVSNYISEVSKKGKKQELKNLTFKQVNTFKELYQYPSTIGTSVYLTGTSTIKSGDKKTDPNVTVMGIDGGYLTASNNNVQWGRSWTSSEEASGTYVCIIGQSIAKKIFGENQMQQAVNRTINVGYQKYRIIGILEAKGGSMRGNMDNMVYVPLQNARIAFKEKENYELTVMVPDIKIIDDAIEEAEEVLRVVRNVPLGEVNNFTITKNSSMLDSILDVLNYISLAAIFIAVITLFGASIGLMNIMLVSVTERTREIGVNKALGASASTIKSQFLTEAILISLIGGCIGIVVGIIIGNVVSVFISSGFVIPWLYILIGLIICTFVGIVSGYYPAAKAAKLDPIAALRYE